MVFEKYFDKSEILIADELWDHLSNEKHTMESILQIINKISTQNFLDYYNFINDINSYIDEEDERQKEERKNKYMDIINKWCLYREKEIFENINTYLENTNSSIKKIIRQPIFLDGDYNSNRERLVLN